MEYLQRISIFLQGKNKLVKVSVAHLKFGYSEKATTFEKILQPKI